MRINVNSNAVVQFTAKLEQVRKTALPSAIRGTLNDAAFHVKQKSMPVEAKKDFVNRSPNFFKANSSVSKAEGWDVNKMRSTVGFIESRLRGGHNFAVKDLEQQERSGDIDGKSFIPMDTARVGGTYGGLVKPANRLTRITNIVNARSMGSGTKKQQFVKAILKAGQGGYVLGSNIKGENILWRVDSLDPTAKNKFSLTPLYDYSKGRKVRVDETGFMQTASLNSAGLLDKFYIAQAKFWIEKYKK